MQVEKKKNRTQTRSMVAHRTEWKKSNGEGEDAAAAAAEVKTR